MISLTGLNPTADRMRPGHDIYSPHQARGLRFNGALATLGL